MLHNNLQVLYLFYSTSIVRNGKCNNTCRGIEKQEVDILVDTCCKYLNETRNAMNYAMKLHSCEFTSSTSSLIIIA